MPDIGIVIIDEQKSCVDFLITRKMAVKKLCIALRHLDCYKEDRLVASGKDNR